MGVEVGPLVLAELDRVAVQLDHAPCLLELRSRGVPGKMPIRRDGIRCVARVFGTGVRPGRVVPGRRCVRVVLAQCARCGIRGGAPRLLMPGLLPGVLRAPGRFGQLVPAVGAGETWPGPGGLRQPAPPRLGWGVRGRLFTALADEFGGSGRAGGAGSLAGCRGDPAHAAGRSRGHPGTTGQRRDRVRDAAAGGPGRVGFPSVHIGHGFDALPGVFHDTDQTGGQRGGVVDRLAGVGQVPRVGGVERARELDHAPDRFADPGGHAGDRAALLLEAVLEITGDLREKAGFARRGAGRGRDRASGVLPRGLHGRPRRPRRRRSSAACRWRRTRARPSRRLGRACSGARPSRPTRPDLPAAPSRRRSAPRSRRARTGPVRTNCCWRPPLA